MARRLKEIGPRWANVLKAFGLTGW